jgi:hypothetical protein
MKRSVLSALFVIALAYSASGDKVGPLGNLSAIEIIGANGIPPENIIKGLRKDSEVFLLSHAMADRDAYLSSLAGQTVSGYRNAGFPHVRVSADISETGGHVILTVEEGPRFTAGKVMVEGAKIVPAEEIVARLTTPYVDPTPALLITPDLKQEPKDDEKISDPVWHLGEPVQCTTQYIDRVKEFLRKVFAEHGFFFPEADVILNYDENLGRAELHITLHDEGPPGRRHGADP